MQISEAVKFVLSIENITTKDELKIWEGIMGHAKLYKYIKQLAPEHWNRCNTPEANVRGIYQRLLIGYKEHRNTHL